MHGRIRSILIGLVSLAVALLVVPGAFASTAGSSGYGGFTTFFRPTPAYQPGALLAFSDGSVLVGSSRHGVQSPIAGADIEHLNPAGKIIGQYYVPPAAGQTQANLFDFAVRGDLLYTVDVSGERLITINLLSGQIRTIATFPDLPDCAGNAVANAECQPSYMNLPAQPIGMQIQPDGSILVADEQEALVWRVPPGGGTPTVWYSDSRFAGYFGISDIRVVDAGTKALLTVDQPNLAALAGVWQVSLDAQGNPIGRATPFWLSEPGDAPLDMTVGNAGTIYVSLTLGNQIVALDSSGLVLDRWPSQLDNVAGKLSSTIVPMDGPTYMALDGSRLLVSNTAWVSAASVQLSHLAVLSATVPDGDSTLPAWPRAKAAKVAKPHKPAKRRKVKRSPPGR